MSTSLTQPALKTADGDELKPLDSAGNPITRGVVTEAVRQAAEKYSKALYRRKLENDEVKACEADLLVEMHVAGVAECQVTDGEGVKVTYQIHLKESVKKEKAQHAARFNN